VEQPASEVDAHDRAVLGTAGADYTAAPDNTFEFGLHAILDGLQAQLVTHRNQ